ncbi:alpha/beta fold hydrolase [Nocardia stercoris]|uniref:Alpha/beta hydrolase n=1 Tax=Nocardia stercoris TaxID=2483361 RepID=A0A3M2LK93_9NOCA|nr:alpha/beta hydrolase [Nocardia stercoris]RMI35188.1 alpha/beta hydrolase [Nocardia stercoris]
MSELNVHRFGPESGPTILALHGLTGHGLRWRLLAERLPDCRVIAPDLRGHGRSTSLPPWTLETVADDVAALIEPRRPVTVVGHSFGGMVAIHLAHRNPELVAGLVLLDPAVGLPPEALLPIAEQTIADPGYADVEAARRDKIATAWQDVAPEILSGELAEHLIPRSDGRLGWRMHTAAVTAYWGELARDVLLPPADLTTTVVYGNQSQVTAPLRVALQRDPRPKLTLREFDCDHMVLEALPDETAAVVRSAL